MSSSTPVPVPRRRLRRADSRRAQDHRLGRRDRGCRAQRRARARPPRDAGASVVPRRRAHGRARLGRRLGGAGDAADGRRVGADGVLASTDGRTDGSTEGAAVSDRIRVMIVDDQALVRAGFRMVLDAEPDIEVVAELGDGQAALDALPGRAVDVVLMDIRMPRLDGIEATRRILARGTPDRPAQGPRPHDLRPRRVRLRRSAGRRLGLPAQGRRPDGAACGDPGGPHRGRGRRARTHASAARPVPAAHRVAPI